MWRNLAIVAVVPPVLLLPWAVQLASSPSELLLEAGLQQPGLAARDLPARSVMLLSPGGPGLPAVWVTAGIVFAALASLLLSRRRGLMLAGWGVALTGFLVGVAVSRVMIMPAAGGSAKLVWPGVALLIAAMCLLIAGATAGEALLRRDRADDGRPGGGGRKGGPGALRGMGVAVLAAVACSAPILAAASWVETGVRGPVRPVAGPVAPAVVTASPESDLQLRTLVLRSDGNQVNYTLLRGASPSLGDADLAPVPAAQRALGVTVASLVAPNGGETVDQGQQLAQFDIGFVLLPAPVNPNLARLLDGVAGLQPLSATSAFDVWRVSGLPARVRVVEPTGTVVALPSGPVGMAGVPAPAAGGTLELAEPASGWEVTLNGKPLAPAASSAGGWAQAFRLPPGGGVLAIGHNQTGRDLILILELVAVAVVAALALPGSRTAAEESAPAPDGAGAASEARPASEAAEGAGPPGGRRARGRGGRVARGPRPDRDTTPGPRRDRRGRPAPRRRPVAADASPGGVPPGGPRARVSWPGVTPEDGEADPEAPWPEGGEPESSGASWPGDDPAPVAGAPWPGDDEPEVAGPPWPEAEPAAAGAPWPEAGPSGTGARWPGDKSADDELAGAGAPWPGAGPSGAEGPWPEAEPADGPPGPGTSWPSRERGGWPAPPPPSSWPESAEPSGWPGAPQPSAWPDGRADSLDPLPPADGRADSLDPLPPADGRRHRRPEPPDDGESARWPVPEHDSGGDPW